MGRPGPCQHSSCLPPWLLQRVHDGSWDAACLGRESSSPQERQGGDRQSWLRKQEPPGRALPSAALTWPGSPCGTGRNSCEPCSCSEHGATQPYPASQAHWARPANSLGQRLLGRSMELLLLADSTSGVGTGSLLKPSPEGMTQGTVTKGNEKQHRDRPGRTDPRAHREGSGSTGIPSLPPGPASPDRCGQHTIFCFLVRVSLSWG